MKYEDEFLNIEKMKYIYNAFGNNLIDVEYFWYPIEEDINFDNLDCINLKFSNNFNLCFTYGSLGENITLDERDENEIINQYSEIQLKVELRVESKINSKNWQKFKNKKLLGCIPMNYKTYCHSTVMLFFEDNLYLEIFCKLDALDVEFDINKIGCLRSYYNY